MRYSYLFGLAAISVVLVSVAHCETDTLEEEAIWEDDVEESTTEVDRSSTDASERSLDLGPNKDNRNPADDDTSKTLEQKLKSVDLGKLMRRNKISADSTTNDESKNIQRVAKKLNVDAPSNSKDVSFMQNVTSSDIGWLTRVFNFILWDPEQLPGIQNVSIDCGSQFKQYLNALHNGTLWATKGKS